MPQIFSKSADVWLRLVLLLTALIVVASLLVLAGLVRSQIVTREDIAPDQPVPFSHQHHVAGLGIDCRYCHTAVEVSESAGYPPTETCMTCHSQICLACGCSSPPK